MDSLSMFAMFAEKKVNKETWKTTSRQIIWKESQSRATSVRSFSGQEMQRPLMYHFYTGANKIWHNTFGAVSNFIFLEQGMVWGKIKPWINHFAFSLSNGKSFTKYTYLNHKTLESLIIFKHSCFPHLWFNQSRDFCHKYIWHVFQMKGSTAWLFGIFMWCQFGHRSSETIL